MIRLEFTDTESLLDFIIYTKEFQGWETMIFRVSADNGIQMDVKTRIADSLGLREYLEFNQLKSTLMNFLNANKHLNINAEIKLKFPDNQRRIMDPHNYYHDFYLNFYSDSQATFATTSFLETSKVLSSSPIISWGVYITGLYNDWVNR